MQVFDGLLKFIVCLISFGVILMGLASLMTGRDGLAYYLPAIWITLASLVLASTLKGNTNAFLIAVALLVVMGGQFVFELVSVSAMLTSERAETDQILESLHDGMRGFRGFVASIIGILLLQVLALYTLVRRGAFET